MAARIAHEVRNPLVSIGGFARLVRKGIAADDPRSDYLRVISDEVARLERIVQGLLDYSRPQQTLDLLDVDVPKLVHEIAVMTRLEAETHGVAIVERFEPRVADGPHRRRQGAAGVVEPDPQLPGRDDARGGRSSWRRALVGDDRFRLTVADNGPGIPAGQTRTRVRTGFHDPAARGPVSASRSANA
jgi:two-component system sensor histidine kinase HydH